LNKYLIGLLTYYLHHALVGTAFEGNKNTIMLYQRKSNTTNPGVSFSLRLVFLESLY